MKTRPLLTAALTAVLLLTAPLNTIASGRTDSPDFRFRGYTGGMMLHSGYIQSRPFELYSTASQSLGTMQIMSDTLPPPPTPIPAGAASWWTTSAAPRAGYTPS